MDRKKLSDLVKKLVEKNTYYSEAQLQFDLAMAIQNESKGYKILLEYPILTLKYKSKNIKRNYVDILVIDENRCYAIELKYKTKEDKKVGLLNHGAEDCGRYDYLWDINRLELLILGSSKQKIENEMINEANTYREKDLEEIDGLEYDKGGYIKNKEVIGFSVFVTNNEKYCTVSKSSSGIPIGRYKTEKAKGSKNDIDFCIAQRDEIKAEDEDILDWKKDPKTGLYTKSVINSFRGRPLKFLSEYTFNWEKLDNKFFYLINEIK